MRATALPPRDYVYAYGVRNPFGGAWRASDGKHYTVENGPSVDRLSQLVAGRNYLYNGSDASMMNFAIYNWNPATAPVNITFVQQQTFGGSQFPASKMDHAFVSESGPTYAPVCRATASNSRKWCSMQMAIASADRLIWSNISAQAAARLWRWRPDRTDFTSPSCTRKRERAGRRPLARIYRVRYVNPIAGDYDIDGDVDNNDYGVWRANFGSNLLLAADGNKNGVVDSADYVVWRNAMSAGAAAAAALPAVSSTTDHTAAAPGVAQAEITHGSSHHVSVEIAAPAATEQMRASASANLIDIALGTLGRSTDAAFGTRRAALARSFTRHANERRCHALIRTSAANVGSGERALSNDSGQRVRLHGWRRRIVCC